MTPPELLLKAVRLLEFSKAETFPDFVHEELRLLSVRLIESALDELDPKERQEEELNPPQIQRVREEHPSPWPSALDETASVSTGRTGSAYNAYMSEAIAMVHTLFPTQSHRANFMMAAGAWKRIKSDAPTQKLVADARELILRESVIGPSPKTTQRTVGLSV
jgi:hypothetical protein